MALLNESSSTNISVCSRIAHSFECIDSNEKDQTSGAIAEFKINGLINTEKYKIICFVGECKVFLKSIVSLQNWSQNKSNNNKSWEMMIEKCCFDHTFLDVFGHFHCFGGTNGAHIYEPHLASILLRLNNNRK